MFQILDFILYNTYSNQVEFANGGSFIDHYNYLNMRQPAWLGLRYMSLLSLLIGALLDGQTSALLSLEKKLLGAGCSSL